MHDFVMETVRPWVEKYDLNEDFPENIDPMFMLEIGARNVNGSVRELMPNNHVWGIDLFEGPGVNEVASMVDHYWGKSEGLDGVADNCYDIVICTEVLEHDLKFWETLTLVGESLKDEGYLILSARGFEPDGKAMWKHDFPYDFYRFSTEVVPELLNLANCDTLENVEDKQHPGFIALGKRRPRKKAINGHHTPAHTSYIPQDMN